ncbi:MAG: tetratricopeptide repeat protein [bacterium]
MPFPEFQSYLKKAMMNGLRLLAGAVFVLLALEAAFRAAGLFFPSPRAIPRRQGEHVILCEGDSATFGVGGIAYPLQLERILNSRPAMDIRFRVINHGIPGSNTTQIYERLAYDIAKIRPDTVIIIAGELSPLSHMERNLSGLPWRAKINRFLLNSKVYKFGKLLFIGFRHASFHEFQESLGNKQPEKTADRILNLQAETERQPDPSTEKFLLKPGRFESIYTETGISENADNAGSLFRRGKLDKAVDGVISTLELAYALDKRYGMVVYRFKKQPVIGEILATAESLRPDSENVLFALGEYNFRGGLFKEAIKYFERAVQKHPRSARSHAGLAMCLIERHDADGAYKLVKKALSIRPDDFKVRMAAARHHFNRTDYPRAAEELLKVAEDKKHILQNVIPRVYWHAHEREKALEFALKVRENERWPVVWKIIEISYWKEKDRNEKVLKAMPDGMRRYSKDYQFAHGLPIDIEKDIQKIYALTRDYEATLILASYPVWRFPEVEKAARKYGIRYVNFKKLLERKFSSKDRFTATDGFHCNTMGYKHMAEVMADEVLHPERSFDPESISP